MKTKIHGPLHRFLTKSEEEPKPRQDGNEMEVAVWILIGILAALVLVFGYLFWNKF